MRVIKYNKINLLAILSKFILTLSLVSFLLIEVEANASTDKKLKKLIDSYAKEEPLKSSLFGFLAVRPSAEIAASGANMTLDVDTLINYNSLKKLLPASNLKLITSGLAMNELGADFRFETKLAYTGEIKNGVLHGDIYIIGGADPTLAGSDDISRDETQIFEIFKRILDKVGINKITGRVIGDGRFFNGPIECDAWDYSDLGTYYGTGGDGLPFYENVKDIHVSAGNRVGTPVNIELGYPETPWMSYIYTCKTAKAGTGDKLYLYTNDLAPVADMRGTFAIDRKPKTEYCSNKFGALTCAYSLFNFLKHNGIEFSEKSCSAYVNPEGNLTIWAESPGQFVNDFSYQFQKENHLKNRNQELNEGESQHTGSFQVTNIQAASVESLNYNLIGSTLSPSLVKIVKEMNHRSDNFYAETLFRFLGKTHSSSSPATSSPATSSTDPSSTATSSTATLTAASSTLTYEKCIKAEYDLLTKMNIDTSHGITIRDGSGLSESNYVSPDFMCRFLKTMLHADCFKDYVYTIPSPGNTNSTLTYMLRAATPEQKSRVYMKSGSLGGVRCFSGYIFPSTPSEYLNSKEACLNSNQTNLSSHNEPIVFSLFINNYDVPTSRINKIIDKILLQLLEY